MNVFAIKCPTCNDIVFSRTRHDFRWCSCESVAIDGGFDYNKISFKTSKPEQLKISVDATKEMLFNDWDTGANKFGVIKELNPL